MTEESIYIKLDNGDELRFIGKYRRDLETDNWHYYEITQGEKTGTLLHVRKDRIVYVESKPIS
jgi:hypothetical protein